MKRKIIVILIAVFMAVLFSVAALADDISDKQDQLEGVQDRIDEAKNKISDLKEEMAVNQNKANNLASSISKVDSEIKDMEKKISDTQGRIDVTTKELNNAIEEYNKQDDLMKKRINALYKNGTSIGFLQVILEASSFSDFITRADIMKKLVDYDISMLKEMKEKREFINNNKVKLEKDKSELVALKNNLDSKKNSLVNQKTEMNKVIALLSRQKSEFESILQQEEAAANKLKKEIKALLSTKKNYDGSKWAILHSSDFPPGVEPRISSTFGYRTDPFTGTKSYHSGLDIATRGYKNIPVYAMAPGRVIISRYYGGYGYAVVIDHGSGVSTLYGHNNSLLVSEGQNVAGGQKIALSGSTGRSTGPHVHFGVQINGEYVDPEPYYMLGY